MKGERGEVLSIPNPMGQKKLMLTTELDVSTLVEVLTYEIPAPTQVFELPVSISKESVLCKSFVQ